MLWNIISIFFCSISKKVAKIKIVETSGSFLIFLKDSDAKMCRCSPSNPKWVQSE